MYLLEKVIITSEQLFSVLIFPSTQYAFNSFIENWKQAVLEKKSSEKEIVKYYNSIRKQ